MAGWKTTFDLSVYAISLAVYTISLGLWGLRSALLATIYGGLVIGLNGGIVGWFGAYIVFIAGLAGWAFNSLYKLEKIASIGILAVAGCTQAIISFQEHPFLASSIILVAGNILLNSPNIIPRYEKLARNYWPISSTILPIGLVTGIAYSPLCVVITIGVLNSWIGDSGSNNTKKESEISKDKKRSDEQYTPRSEFKETQQSQQTAEDINTRRPDDGES